MVQIKKILIIEDEKPMARALTLKLTRDGFRVEVAFDGEKGFALLQKEAFDLILLDVMMPKMNGFRVLEEMRKLKLKTPVIMLSNLSQEEDEKRAKELGAREFFIKSNTSLSEIIEHVKSILV